MARPRKRARVTTTDSNHAYPTAPNRLARQFDVNGVGLDRVWVADITYVPTREGTLYLAIVLDLGSRRWWAGRWARGWKRSWPSGRSAWRARRADRRPD